MMGDSHLILRLVDVELSSTRPRGADGIGTKNDSLLNML